MKDGPSLEDLRSEFDAWADTYDGDVDLGGGVLAGYALSRTKARGLVEVRAGGRVLDVGIGTGALSELFAGEGAEITGVDISPRMLEICAKRHPGWRLLEGDFLHLPVPDGSQDLVVSSFAMHHLSDRDRDLAVQECMRVLCARGKFLLVDIMFQDGARLRAARERLWESWDEENYATFPELRRLSRRLFLRVHLKSLSDLHGAAVFEAP